MSFGTFLKINEQPRSLAHFHARRPQKVTEGGVIKQQQQQQQQQQQGEEMAPATPRSPPNETGISLLIHYGAGEEASCRGLPSWESGATPEQSRKTNIPFVSGVRGQAHSHQSSALTQLVLLAQDHGSQLTDWDVRTVQPLFPPGIKTSLREVGLVFRFLSPTPQLGASFFICSISINSNKLCTLHKHTRD